MPRSAVLASAAIAAAAAAAILAGGAPALGAPTPATATTSCTVTSATGFASCVSSSNILIQGPFTVPAETTIDMSGLSSGATVTVSGTVSWAKSTSLTTDDFLFTLGGAGVTFDGTNGVFNGNGQDYWDGLGANGGVNKPKFFKVLTTANSVVKGLTILNSPVHVFSVSGSDTTFDAITVDDSAGDAGGGHNTDAFDVSATNIIIQNSNIHNQDDCLAVNSGSNIQFIGNTCVGGHGISIGSIASDKTVDTVTVKDCSISDSQNGVRIKTVFDATGGFVKNVAYSGITLSGITSYGIVIEQDYENGSPTGTPTGGIPISAVTLTDITGSMASGAKHSVYLLCAACTDFAFSGISITGSSSSCTGVSPLPQGCSGSTATAAAATTSTTKATSTSTKATTSSTKATTSTTAAAAVTTLATSSKTTSTTTTAAAAAATTTTAAATLASTITTSAAAAATTTAAVARAGAAGVAYVSKASVLSANMAEDLAIEADNLAEISSFSAKLATETNTVQIAHDQGRISKDQGNIARAAADIVELQARIASLEALLATKTA